jgi:hypothetical protein
LRENPERTAWTVLLSAFATFCLLAVSVPLGIRWYIINATSTPKTALTAISGTILVEERGQARPLAVTEGIEASEGASIKTDSTSQAILTFLEDSTATLYNDTQVVLLRTRMPRFSLSPRPNTIILEVKKGRVRIGAAPAIDSPLYFEVRSPHGVAVLEEGSYSVEVTDEQTQIVVRYGQALATAAGATVELNQGQRTTIAVGEAPADPMPAAQPLVVNGNFQQDLSAGWIAYNEQGIDEGQVDGEVEIVSSGNRRALFFSRMGEDGNHCETGIIQKTDKDIRDFTSLKLHLDVRLIYQSLSGGGFFSSEFPIMIRLDYKDPYGNDRFWVHGFYYQNDENYPMAQYGEQIPRYVWYPYETGNLLEILADTRPTYINAIRIYASGWEYQSMISEVGLTVE